MIQEYFSIADIVKMKIKGLLAKDKVLMKAHLENWEYRTVNREWSTKPIKEYHISNFSESVRGQIVEKLLQKQRIESELKGKNIEYQTKANKIGYCRLEIVQTYNKNMYGKSEFITKYLFRELKISLETYREIQKISTSQLSKWLVNYEIYGGRGLLPKLDERKLGKSKYRSGANNIKDIVVGILLKKPHLKNAVIYKLLENMAKEEEYIMIPSYKTICRYIADYKAKNKAQFLLAQNPDAYKNKYLLALGSYSEEAKAPNYIWELDSTPTDVFLEGGRHTIIGCIDVYSRRVKFFVQKSSNSLGITTLLRACILEWGIPKIVKTDNGKDYTSQQIQIVLNEFAIEHRLARAFQGQEKPHIERVFRRFQHDLSEVLPNFIGHNVGERKAIESIKSYEERLFGKEPVIQMSLDRYQEFCNWWVEDQYMSKAHNGLKGATPNSMLANYTPKLLVGEQIRKLDLLLEPLAGQRTIVKKGIRVENNFYFNPTLAMYIGEQVIVRVDRFDMGKIYVFSQGGDYICEAVNYNLLGEDKQAFIAKTKEIESNLYKQAKKKIKQSIKNIDKTPLIQVDIEEAIAQVEEQPKVVEQSEWEEGESRYQKARGLEAQIANNIGVDNVKMQWLQRYKQTPEYKVKYDRDLHNKE